MVAACGGVVYLWALANQIDWEKLGRSIHLSFYPYE